jgi:hypothetical protein
VLCSSCTSDLRFALIFLGFAGDGESLDSADLMLIKLASPAPPGWRPQRLAFGLESAIAGLTTGGKEGGGAGAAGLTSLIGNPSLVVYGFGDRCGHGAHAPPYCDAVLPRAPRTIL